MTAGRSGTNLGPARGTPLPEPRRLRQSPSLSGGRADGETPQNYHACSRTLNHVIARAAREGRILTKDPRDADAFRHDGDVSNEWELVTLERLKRAARVHSNIELLRDNFPGTPKATRPLADTASMSTPTRGETPTSCCGTRERRSCPSWASSTPGTRWAEIAAAIARHDAAGATPSAATWNASTSIPAVGASGGNRSHRRRAGHVARSRK